MIFPAALSTASNGRVRPESVDSALPNMLKSVYEYQEAF
jgi:hypothetical protein